MPATNTPGPGVPATLPSGCFSYVQGNDGTGNEGSTFGRPNYDKVKFWIKDYTKETIFFGFRNHLSGTTVTYAIITPAGDSLSWGTVGTSAGDGYIADDLIEAYVGPKEIYGAGPGGYDATLATPTMNGEYYIEF